MMHMLRPGDLNDFLGEMLEATKSWKRYTDFAEMNAEFLSNNDFLIPIYLNSYALHFVKSNHGGWLVVDAGADGQEVTAELNDLLEQVADECEDHVKWSSFMQGWSTIRSQIADFDGFLKDAFIYGTTREDYGGLSIAGTREDYDKLGSKEMSPEMVEIIGRLKAKLSE